LDFDDAMSTFCRLCGTTASVHRLTPTGNLYCLELNPAGRRYIVGKERWGWRDWMLTNMPVKYLRRSAIKQDVGVVIHQGLNAYVNP
jgi:hypothetical protein